jgi:antitoxin VapB
MAVNLKNLEAERLLNELAELTGESLTEAAMQAFSERLARLKAELEARRGRKLGSLIDLIEEARAQPAMHDGRSLKQIRDELWGDA